MDAAMSFSRLNNDTLSNASKHKIKFMCIAPHRSTVMNNLCNGLSYWMLHLLHSLYTWPYPVSDAPRLLRASPQSLAEWMHGTSLQQKASHARLLNTDHDLLCPVLRPAEQKTFQLCGHHWQCSLERDAQAYQLLSSHSFCRVG